MKADLHVHSTHSDDGKQTVDELVKRCVELGIGAVAITDHNTMGAHQDAERHAASKLIIVPATEVTTADGHILALGVTGVIPRGFGVAETLTKIHEAGGIAIAPHPYRMWSGLGEDNIRENRFDAIEVKNGRSKRRANTKAERLASSLGLPGVGGSDAHDVSSIGRVYTEVPDRCRTWNDIIEAIRSGNCSAVGEHLSPSSSLGHGARTFSDWFRRGFRRM
jgi:predicted metal-dependent phosphoesterase TrpH